jgi:hypothetical protein
MTSIAPVLDSAFEKDLKEFARSKNSKLWVEFDQDTERFIIYQPSKQYKKAIAMVIETEDGGFRQPNITDIALLYWGDLYRKGDPRAMMIFGEEKALEKMETDEKRAETELKEATIDNKYYLRRKLLEAAGEVSDAPHVRRVTPKSRGYKVMDNRKMNRDQI